MSGITNEALSALLDGELDAERAALVRAAIAADPALRAEYEALARMDEGLADLAETMAFMPDIALPEPVARRSAQIAAGAAVLVLLLLVRFLPKIGDMAQWSLMMQAAAASLILVAVVRLALGHGSFPHDAAGQE